MKTISILIPSRGNPKELLETIASCEDMAAQSSRLEFIVRLDGDDPALSDYITDVTPTVAWRRAVNKGDFVKWIVGEPFGYARIHDYYEEMYRMSKGDLLLAFNDDMRIDTKFWDCIFEETLSRPFMVAGCQMDEGNGTNYAWAMPMVRRDLCEAIGRFCSGTETCDRIFEAYSKFPGRGAIAPVKMLHKWQPLKPGSERERVYRHAQSNWGEMTQRWNRAAAEMERACHALGG